MQKYDLTVLTGTDLKPEAREALSEKIEKIVKILGGKITKSAEMGRKQLAYPIKNLSEAFFNDYQLEVEAAAVVQLKHKLTIDREILRHLLVRVDK